MNKILSIALATTMAIGLTGCASATAPEATDAAQTCDQFKTGSVLDGIEVIDNKNAMPTVNLTNGPLKSDVIETKVIKEGSGQKFLGNQLAKVEYVSLNASSGDAFQASHFDGSDAATQYLQAGSALDICHALSGVKEGSRVAVIFPAEAAHGGKGLPEFNVNAGDDIIFIFDLLKVYPSYATGEAQTVPSEFPKITEDEKHVPSIAAPTGDAPTEFKVAVTKKGTGEIVKQGQNVALQYAGFLWDGAKQFDSSWASGQPTQFELTKGKLIDGFIKALDGQTVGSQVIAIIPPKDGYKDKATGSIPPNSTLVFVVDILGVD